MKRPAFDFGAAIAAFAVVVAAPFLMRVFFHLHHFEPAQWVSDLTKWVPAVGLSVAGTLGGAYIGSTMLLYRERRAWLAAIWLVIISGVTYVIAGVLIAEYTGTTLTTMPSDPGLWLFMIAAVLVPELAAVGAMVSSAVRNDRRTSTEEAMAERDAARVEAAQLRQDLADTRERLEAFQVQQVSKRGGDVQPSVLQALKDAGEWLTIAELAPLASQIAGRELNRDSVRSAVARLADNEMIAKAPAPVGSRERYVYAAATPGQELPPLPAGREVA